MAGHDQARTVGLMPTYVAAAAHRGSGCELLLTLAQGAVDGIGRGAGNVAHDAIVNAIELREGGRAEALAREHGRLARQNLEYVIEHDRSLMRRVPALALVTG